MDDIDESQNDNLLTAVWTGAIVPNTAAEDAFAVLRIGRVIERKHEVGTVKASAIAPKDAAAEATHEARAFEPLNGTRDRSETEPDHGHVRATPQSESALKRNSVKRAQRFLYVASGPSKRSR